MNLDVCLEMVFPHLPTEERIARVADAGYPSVEFWFHDATFDGHGFPSGSAKDPAAVRQSCQAHGVTLNNIVLNSPDGGFGGSPVDSNDLTKYLDRTEEVIAFAEEAGCSMAITCTGNCAASLDRSQMRSNLENALGRAAEIASRRGFQLVLEPLNRLVDHEGYFLASSIEAAAIVRSINSPGLRVLYDVYHMQIMEGNIITNIRQQADVIGHYHSAGVPGRNEHFDTEVNYPAVLKAIRETGYTGCFGLEYSPALPNHHDSLVKVREYLES